MMGSWLRSKNIISLKIIDIIILVNLHILTACNIWGSICANGFCSAVVTSDDLFPRSAMPPELRHSEKLIFTLNLSESNYNNNLPFVLEKKNRISLASKTKGKSSVQLFSGRFEKMKICFVSVTKNWDKGLATPAGGPPMWRRRKRLLCPRRASFVSLPHS